MADRTTKTITTSGAHTVVLYDYITGGEFEKLMRAMQEAPTNPSSASVNIGAALDANHIAFNTLIVSIDGSTENILDTILAFPLEDYLDVRSAVEELTSAKKK